MVEQLGVEASKVDLLTTSVDGLNKSFDYLNEHAYQEFLNKANDNSWDANGSFFGLLNGENYSKLVSSFSDKSNIQKIQEEMENASVYQI